MYNRYQGNSGKVRRIEEPGPAHHTPSAPFHPGAEQSPPGPLSGLSGELWRFARRLSGVRPEAEDLLLMALLYLLYRESGDEEFLLAIGALLLC